MCAVLCMDDDVDEYRVHVVHIHSKNIEHDPRSIFSFSTDN